MKITFTYEDEHEDDRGVSRIEVTTTSEYLDTAVERFKAFLIHVGHHHGNVERIALSPREDKQGFPQQLELPLTRPEAL